MDENLAGNKRMEGALSGCLHTTLILWIDVQIRFMIGARIGYTHGNSGVCWEDFTMHHQPRGVYEALATSDGQDHMCLNLQGRAGLHGFHYVTWR